MARESRDTDVTVLTDRLLRPTPQFPSADMSIISEESGFIAESRTQPFAFIRSNRIESNENRERKKNMGKGESRSRDEARAFL